MKEGESLIRKNNRGKHVHGESQSDMLLFAPSHDQTPKEGEWMDGRRPILIDVRENGQDTRIDQTRRAGAFYLCNYSI